MKLGLLGDVHAKVRAPEGRCDDWFNVQLGKFRSALDWFTDKGCEYILQPGDFFDSPKPVNMVLSAYINELRKYEMEMLAVLGQHDTYYHDVVNAERTALHVLQSAGVAVLLGDKPFKHEGVHIYGASWGQEPPAMRRSSGNVKCILVAHAMVGDKPLWPGHDMARPKQYANRHPGYNLIFLGDYHYRFMADCGETRVVNMGSLMRMRNTPRDRQHAPAVGVYDTETGHVDVFALDVEPAATVFVEPKEGKSEPSVALNEFLDRLKRSGQLGTSFLDNLEAVMDAQDADGNVKVVVDEILETVGVKE